MAERDEEEGFLGRWSRLKRERATASVEPTPEEEKPLEPTGETGPVEHAGEEQEEVQAVDPATLPDPDSLEAGSDFKPFMAKGVPADLKRRALRRLWRSNPVLANVDGLLEYGEDFTDAATVVENLQTAYRVGKGFLRDIEEEAPAPEPLEEIAADGPAPEIENEQEGAGASEGPSSDSA